MEREINKFHALQLFTDTFAAETVHLTNQAVGIYIRLLSFAWTKNTKPFTTESAYRICQCTDGNCHTDVDDILNLRRNDLLSYCALVSSVILLLL